MDAEINVQLDFFERITKAYTNYKKSPKDRITVTYLETRLESLEKLWNQFSSVHTSLVEGLTHAGVAKSVYGTRGIYDVTDELYMDYKCALKTAHSMLIQQQHVSSSSSSSPASKSSQVNLPKITIPTFSGQYTEWMSFRDLFISLIHDNADIDNVQKLHCLKTNLRGEAEQLLRHVPITNDSYQEAWNLLKRRYNNKQYLVNCILQRFFGQRSVTSESSNAIKELLDLTNETLNSLVNLGIDTGSWDVIIIYIVSQKLDPESRKQWEAEVSKLVTASDQLPNITKFRDFLETRFHSLEFLDSNPSSAFGPRQRTHTHNYSNNVQANPIHALHTAQISCDYCKQDHNIRNCKGFISIDFNSKRDFVQTHGLCYNCLRNNHSAKHCRNTASCQICHGRHHSLLHSKSDVHPTESNGSVGNQVVSQVNSVKESEEIISSTSTNIASHFVKGVAQEVLLATAMVKAESRNDGEYQLLRALIDQGSQASFITNTAVQLLGLKPTPTKGIISGLGGEQGLISRSKVELKFSSRLNPGCVFQVSAYILAKLTAYSPSSIMSVTSWPELEKVELADPEYHTANKIDILLGAEVYSRIIDNGIIKCPSGSLVAQNTTLGWILSGHADPQKEVTCNVTSMHTTVQPVKQFCTSFRDKEVEPCNKPETFHFLQKELQEDQHLKQKNTQLSIANESIEVNITQKVIHEEKGTQTKILYLPHQTIGSEDKETSKVCTSINASSESTKEELLRETNGTSESSYYDIEEYIEVERVEGEQLLLANEKLKQELDNRCEIEKEANEAEKQLNEPSEQIAIKLKSSNSKVKFQKIREGLKAKLKVLNNESKLTLTRSHETFTYGANLSLKSASVRKGKIITKDISELDDVQGSLASSMTNNHLVGTYHDHVGSSNLRKKALAFVGLTKTIAYCNCRRILKEQKTSRIHLRKEIIDIVLIIFFKNCQNKVFTGDIIGYYHRSQ